MGGTDRHLQGATGESRRCRGGARRDKHVKQDAKEVVRGCDVASCSSPFLSHCHSSSTSVCTIDMQDQCVNENKDIFFGSKIPVK